MENEIEDNNESLKFRPGTGRALAYGWKAMKSNFLLFLLIEIVIGLIFIPTSFGSGSEASLPFFSFLMLAYWFLFIPVIQYGASLIYLQGTRGDEVKINGLLKGFKCYLNVILASLLVFGLIGVGLIIFIIPGIYVACRLAFVSYLVMDEGLDPVAAVEGSWRITRGHAWKIFCLAVMSIIIVMGGLLLMIIGSIPAAMWAKASFAALYLSITEQGTKTIEGSNIDGSPEDDSNKALVIGAVCLVLVAASGIFWSIQSNVINEIIGDAETRTLVLDATNLDQFEIDGNTGFIDITGRSDISEIQVVAEIGAYRGELELSLEADGNEAELIAKINQVSRKNWTDNGRINLTIEVPTDMDIDVDTGFGSITVSNIVGNVNLDSGSGRVDASTIDGSLAVDTGSGAVVAKDISSKVVIDTGSGHVSAENIGDDILVDTGSGRIELINVGGNVLADTGSGSINIALVVGDVTVDTGSGSITVDQVQGSLTVEQGSGSLEISNVDGTLTIE